MNFQEYRQIVASPTCQDLLRAVLAEPNNDTPRQIYADYLEEHGATDRAEFIRAAIELAKIWSDPPRLLGVFDLQVTKSYTTHVQRFHCRLRRHDLLGADVREGDKVQVLFGTWYPLARINTIDRSLTDVDDLVVDLEVLPNFRIQRIQELASQCRRLVGDPTNKWSWMYSFYGMLVTNGQWRRHACLVWKWWRGFVEGIDISSQDWYLHGAMLAARTPLRRVKLHPNPVHYWPDSATSSRDNPWYIPVDLGVSEAPRAHNFTRRRFAEKEISVTCLRAVWRQPAFDGPLELSYAHDNEPHLQGDL